MRKAITFFFGFSVLALCAGAAPPNIIIVMLDDVGLGGLSCYDNKYYKTPNMDQLAADGMLLTDFHSNGNVCSPTRAAFITGRYPQRLGLDGVLNASPSHPMHVRGLMPEQLTFPEALKEAGYVTGLMGKWHVGYLPQFNPVKHGFDEFKGFISGNICTHSHYRLEHDWWQNEERKDQPGYHTDLITENSLSFIERNKDKPFFLFVSHGALHLPTQPRGAKYCRGPNKGKLPDWAPEETYSRTPGDDDWVMRHFMLPVDEGLGRIRTKLVELGLDKNTIIWLCSDNGGTHNNLSFGTRTRGEKAMLLEGGHHVPSIVWAPGRIPADSTCDALITTVDVMPTCLKQAGITLPEDTPLDGMDVSPAIFEGKTLPPLKRYWGTKATTGAMRDGKWKLLLSPMTKTREKLGVDAEIALFNLATDPREEVNLADKYPERTKAMVADWNRWHASALKDSPYYEERKSASSGSGKRK
jgi:arylsulfatase A-like enzyme